MGSFEECMSFLKSDFKECPGRYCGRVLLNDTSCAFSECQKCPRGYRPTELDVCKLCDNDLSLYDYMYLGFMLNFSIMLNFIFIDRSLRLIHKKAYDLSWLKIFSTYLLSLFECVIAFFLTIVLFSPTNNLKLRTCSVESIYDWYSIFFNPYIDYYQKLNCSQEIVYPLYSFCLVFFLLAIFIMMCLRPIFLKLVIKDKIISTILNQPTFAALYFYPLLILLQVIAGGLLYYTYPYITIIVSLITKAFYLCGEFKHMPSEDRSFIDTIIFSLKLFKKTRHVFTIAIHWYFYSFSIIAIAALRPHAYDYTYLLLVPAPLIFFVLSYNFTDPKYFKS